jgi:hypothetical protein
MTINQRTLMRMPLGKLHKICQYWGLTYYSDDRIYTAAGEKYAHRVKQIYVMRLLEHFDHRWTELLKSDFLQWRHI